VRHIESSYSPTPQLWYCPKCEGDGKTWRVEPPGLAIETDCDWCGGIGLVPTFQRTKEASPRESARGYSDAVAARRERKIADEREEHNRLNRGRRLLLLGLAVALAIAIAYAVELLKPS
jgi:hypothetical protein